MKIIGILVVGPHEKYLKSSLDEFKRLCDDALIATNNADDATLKLLDEYGYHYYEDNREWGIYQPDIKTELLTRAGKYNPDWIIALDADEQFAPEVTRVTLEKLAGGNEIAYYFMVVNLYNDQNHFAHSTGIQRFWNIRFYKYLPKYGLQFQRQSLHCGLGPPIAYKYGWYAPYYLLHYGLMDKEDRLRKAERYQKYDPHKKFKAGDYYDELVMDLPTRLFEPEKFLLQLSDARDTKVRVTPKRVMRISNGTEPIE